MNFKRRNMSFSPIRENKILAKISWFTVLHEDDINPEFETI